MTEELYQQLLLVALVMTRMTGFVLFNPVLGRRGIPAMTKAGMIFALTVVAYPGGGMGAVTGAATIGYMFMLIKELFVGYVLGFVMNLFSYMTAHAGAIMDFQMGLTMATVYDPVNGSQTAVTGTLLNIYYTMLFFAADGHLMMIRIMLNAAKVVPYGEVVLRPECWTAIIDIFKDCTVLAVKLAFPLIAAEMLLQVGVGILMRVVPQMNLFVMNIQMKILVGFVSLIFLISPFGDFITIQTTRMLNTMQEMLYLMAAG